MQCHVTALWLCLVCEASEYLALGPRCWLTYLFFIWIASPSLSLSLMLFEDVDFPSCLSGVFFKWFESVNVTTKCPISHRNVIAMPCIIVNVLCPPSWRQFLFPFLPFVILFFFTQFLKVFLLLFIYFYIFCFVIPVTLFWLLLAADAAAVGPCDWWHPSEWRGEENGIRGMLLNFALNHIPSRAIRSRLLKSHALNILTEYLLEREFHRFCSL